MSLLEHKTYLNAGSTITGALLLWLSKTILQVLKALLKGLTIIKSTSMSFIFYLHSMHCSIPF